MGLWGFPVGKMRVGISKQWTLIIDSRSFQWWELSPFNLFSLFQYMIWVHPTMPVTTRILSFFFRLGEANLNLHFPLASWVGARSKISSSPLKLHLVGGSSKIVKIGIFPKLGWNKKHSKPPPSIVYLALLCDLFGMIKKATLQLGGWND